MMDVSGSHHTLDADGLCHAAHKLGYRLLVVVAVAAQIVGYIEVDVFSSFDHSAGVCANAEVRATASMITRTCILFIPN